MNDNNENYVQNPSNMGKRLVNFTLASFTIMFLVGIFTLPFVLTIRANEAELSATTINNTVAVTTNPACETTVPVLAEYQAWHGLPSHDSSSPYTSTNPADITRHILSAKEKCIYAFVVDWYGPADGMSNDEDREFIDQVFAELLRQAELYDFKVGIMYDEGTLTNAAPITHTRTISDLLYASKYFSSSAYLNINDNPALFVFPYETIDPDINWQDVRQQLPGTVTLIDKDPNPTDPSHDASFDGFYAWVQSDWQADGTEWGEGYLRWFYPTMAGSYSDKVSIGGVWPGFNDSSASWGSGRYIWPRCGQTWQDTWDIANEFSPDYIMIDTWNDFEEGTDIEYGIGKCLSSGQTKCAGSGAEAVYVHSLMNTGKFDDTFNLTTSSSRGWATSASSNSIMLASDESIPVTFTLTLPPSVSDTSPDYLYITATSTISTSVMDGVTDTTTIPCLTYLPVIISPSWQEYFDPIQQTWSEVTAVWIDVPGPTAILQENNPSEDFGKVESEIITLNMDTYPILRIKTTDVDPSSSYTVQINNTTNAVAGITSPSEHAVNISDLMGWSGMQSFTINVWISGEGKTVTFDYIGFEEE
ncbi:MAG: hypothetical protein GY805_36275 [Chloroflexi bacterium]|nr:hypothetical protein [Chloroflexota bacterium]